MSDYVDKLDGLISDLESVIEDHETTTFSIESGEPPRRGTYRILSGAYTSLADRKPRRSEIHSVSASEVLLRSQADVSRGMEVEVKILAEKTGKGEVLQVVTGNVIQSRRVSGAYEIQTSIENLQKKIVPAHQRFLDSISAGDSMAWNRWCADLNEGAELKGLDLSRSVLANFDLSCADLSSSNLQDADLSGANLAGADLSDCNLDGVNIAGADLFRARLPRRYMGLLLASGMIEVESVILE